MSRASVKVIEVGHWFLHQLAEHRIMYHIYAAAALGRVSQWYGVVQMDPAVTGQSGEIVTGLQ